MSTTNLLFIAFLLLMIFVPITLFIIESQKESQQENDEVVELKQNFVSDPSFFNSFLKLGLSLSGLYIAYLMLFNHDEQTNAIVGIVASVFSVLFILPVLNSLNHYRKESKRTIYFFRTKKVLLIVENRRETTIDLEDERLKIIHHAFEKTSKYHTLHEKYTFVLEDKTIAISTSIKFPQDFFDNNKITKQKTRKIFIWI